MKFELSDFKPFVSIMDTANKILDEVKFECDSQGVRFKALDKSHICFYSAIFDKSYFDEYVIDEPTNFLVDTTELLKVLKRGKGDDTLTVEDNEDSVKLVFTGESRRTFTIRQIDAEYHSPTPPVSQHPVNVELGFDTFKEAVKDCELFEKKFDLEYKDERIWISVDNVTGGTVNEIITDDHFDENYKSTYSSEMVKDIFGLNFTQFINVSFGNDMPLVLKLQTLSEDLTVEYLLAPRIENR